MLIFPSILRSSERLEPFWRWVVERVAQGDAPFGCTLKQDKICFEAQALCLTEATAIELVEWFNTTVNIPKQISAFRSWKDVRKQGYKQKYLDRAFPEESGVTKMDLFLLTTRKIVANVDLKFTGTIPLELSEDSHQALRAFL